MSFPFAIVGFDLDGTLLDTSRDLAAAANAALAAGGRGPLPVEAVLARVGGGTRNMLAGVLEVSGGATDAEVDRLLPVLLAHYEANMTVHTRPYPGAVTALDALASRGVALAVVTNKLERFATTLLVASGLRDRFACVIGGDTLPLGKPAPDGILDMIRRCGGGRAAFVGDSIYDVQAATAAGVPVIACRFGFSPDEVDSLGADAVIDDFAALVPALERLG
jgi:phosphoglycolate phosphatase